MPQCGVAIRHDLTWHNQRMSVGLGRSAADVCKPETGTVVGYALDGLGSSINNRCYNGAYLRGHALLLVWPSDIY